MRFYTHKDYKGKYALIEKDNDGQSKYIDIKSSEIYIAWDNLMEEISFHEAFRNDVNKIVLEAVTSQNRDSIWNHNNKQCLAVSDFQKDWILKHYVLKHEVNENFADYVKLKKAHETLISEYKELQKENLLMKERIMELTQKSIDDQRVNDQRFCDLYDSKKAISDKFQEATAYIGELKKFILHLQDYIAGKHLEENGLILEKFIQEENTNASRKESYIQKETSI